MTATKPFQMIIIAALVGAWCLAGIGCRSRGGTSGARARSRAGSSGARAGPDKIIKWYGSGGGFSDYGCAGEYVYGVSVKPVVLDVWRWSGGILKMHKQAPLENSNCPTLASDNRLIHNPMMGAEAAEKFLLLEDLQTGRALQRFALVVPGWYCAWMRSSRNGKYVAVGLDEEPTEPSPGFDWDKPRIRIGIIPPKGEKINWAATLVGNRMGQESDMRTVIPSDDGGYVAVAGWDNRAAMVDVGKRKVLWEICPKEAVSLVDIAFTPDSTRVYTGGAKGCVYGMDVRTGKILSRWFATKTGRSEYGHRISTVAVSPDGRFVAAGTGPAGLVWLWSADSGKKLNVLNHGGSTILILSFSPDSTALATVAAGYIKIWKMPQ